MDYGVFLLLPRRNMGRSAAQVIEDGLQQAIAAEQLGFHTVWLAEHHFSNYGAVPSPLHFAITIAERTKQVRIGTAVLVLPFYNAVRMAEDIALVDILTGGRLVVGVGRGYQKYEFERFGLSVDDSRSLFNENMEVLRRAFTEPSFSFKGQHYNLKETSLQVRPLQQPHPPIWVAAASPESITWTVEHDYSLITTAGIRPLDNVRRMRDAYNEQLQAAGKDPRRAQFGLQRYVYVADGRRDALDAVQEALYTNRIADRYRSGSESIAGGVADASPLPDEPTADELTDRLIFGDPETCIEKLQREIDEFRPTHLSFFMAFGGLNQRRVLRSMRRFAEEVLPYIKAPRREPVAAAA